MLLRLILLLRAAHGDEREVARAQLQPDLLFFVLVGRFDEDVLEGALLSRRPPLGGRAGGRRLLGQKNESGASGGTLGPTLGSSPRPNPFLFDKTIVIVHCHIFVHVF